MFTTDIHKLAGFAAGVIVAYFAKRGTSLDPDTIAAILVGVTMLVSTLVGKKTNPTGANQSDARKALESTVVTERTAEFNVQRGLGQSKR